MTRATARGYRVGIVGTGGMGAERAEGIAGHPELTLSAISGRNTGTRSALARRYGVLELDDWRDLVSMADLDAVFVATLPNTHAEIALGALQQGKHVFTEPPLAMTVSDADAVAKEARSRRLVVRVGHSPVLRPDSLVVAEQVERLGGPVLDDIRVQFVDDLRRGRAAGFDVRVTGHPLLYGITLGLPAIHGKGPIASGRASTLGLGEGPVFESCVVTAELTFESGAVSTIAYVRGFAWAGPGWRTVSCVRGSVRAVDGVDGVEVTTVRGVETLPLPDDTAYATEIDDFARAVRTGSPLAFTLEDARRVVAIAEAAQRSAREGRPIGGEPPPT